MKIITGSEAAKLVFAATRSRNLPIYLTAATLEIGESLQLSRFDWKSKVQPTLNGKKALAGKKFQTRRLADGGFIITRIA